jgi:hypothetical protein
MILKTDQASLFADAVERFCRIIEKVESLPNALFLEQLDETLPELYAHAHRLPLIWADNSRDIDHPVAINDLEEEARERIAARLGELDEYTFVYDPVDPKDRELHNTSLSVCIADVYADLKAGLAIYRLGSDAAVKQAIFEWRFGLENNWGRHAVEVLLPIHSLIHHHYDEDDEVFNI